MGGVLLTIIVVYLLVSLFGYLVHKALHQSWAGRFNKAHMAHHLVLYPPEDFLSNDTYREAGKDNTFWTFALASLPMLGAPIILFILGTLPLYLTIIVVIEMLLIGWLNSYLHDSLHIRNHWLFRVPIIKNIFSRWQDLHRLHHIDMDTNFGIFAFHWDRMFKTYWDEKL